MNPTFAPRFMRITLKDTQQIMRILIKPFNYYYHIRNLRLIRRYLLVYIAKTISTALVISKLDYSNSLFHNIAITDITKLQGVQNCLARVVTRSPCFTLCRFYVASKVAALASCPISCHL